MNEVGQCFGSWLVIGFLVFIQCSDALGGETLSSLYGWQSGSSWTVVVKSRVLDVEAPSARGTKPDRFQKLGITYTYNGLVTEDKNTFAEFILKIRRETEFLNMRVLYRDGKGGYPERVFGADGKELEQLPRDVPLFIPLKRPKSEPEEQDVGEDKVRIMRVSGDHVIVEDYDVWQPSPSAVNAPSYCKTFERKGKGKPYVLLERLVINWPKGASWWQKYKRYHGRMELPVVEASLKD